MPTAKKTRSESRSEKRRLHADVFKKVMLELRKHSEGISFDALVKAVNAPPSLVVCAMIKGAQETAIFAAEGDDGEIVYAPDWLNYDNGKRPLSDFDLPSATELLGDSVWSFGPPL